MTNPWSKGVCMINCLLKTCVVFCIAILFSNRVHAQTHLGVSIGMSFSYFSTSYAPEFDDITQTSLPIKDKIVFVFSPRPGIVATAISESPIVDKLSIRMEAHYAQERTVVGWDISQAQGVSMRYFISTKPPLSANVTINAFGLTPSIQYNIYEGRVSSYITVGPSFQYLYVQDLSSELIYSDPENRKNAVNDKEDASKQFAVPEFALAFATGAKGMALGQTIFFEVRCEVGLNSLFKPMPSTQNSYLERDFGHSSMGVNSLRFSVGTLF